MIKALVNQDFPLTHPLPQGERGKTPLPQAGGGGGGREWSLWSMVALILFAFGVLALTALWQSLWLDEVFSIWYVRGSFVDTWSRAIFPEQNPHASLYYALFWGWVQMAGTSDLAARFFSIVFGTLSLATAYRLTRDWMDGRVALFVALLMAVSPFFIWYAQEARQYALYLFFGLMSTLCLSRAIGLGIGLGAGDSLGATVTVAAGD